MDAAHKIISLLSFILLLMISLLSFHYFIIIYLFTHQTKVRIFCSRNLLWKSIFQFYSFSAVKCSNRILIEAQAKNEPIQLYLVIKQTVRKKCQFSLGSVPQDFVWVVFPFVSKVISWTKRATSPRHDHIWPQSIKLTSNIGNMSG